MQSAGAPLKPDVLLLRTTSSESSTLLDDTALETALLTRTAVIAWKNQPQLTSQQLRQSFTGKIIVPEGLALAANGIPGYRAVSALAMRSK
jgi:hypothetical protein